MPWYPVEQAEALKRRFRALEAANDPKDEAALDCCVFLVGWLERTPQATEALYRSVLARAMESGVVRPPIKYVG